MPKPFQDGFGISIDSRSHLVSPELAEHKCVRPTLGVGLEKYLGIHNTCKKIGSAFGVNLQRPLARELSEELVALARNCHEHVESKLILPNISVEDIGIKGNFRVLLGWPKEGRVGRQKL